MNIVWSLEANSVHTLTWQASTQICGSTLDLNVSISVDESGLFDVKHHLGSHVGLPTMRDAQQYAEELIKLDLLQVAGFIKEAQS